MTNRPNSEIMLEIRLNQAKTDSDSQDAYDDIYENIDIAQSNSFYNWFYKKLALDKDDSYLDISCGKGHLVGRAKDQGIYAHGLDLSFQALRVARQRQDVVNLVTANSQRLPYADESFNVVSNVGSLEHYLDMPTAVRETARVLRSDGRCIILVPNTFSLFTNVWYAFRHGRTSIDPYQPIQRYGARFEWQELLENNGLKVVNTIKFERVLPDNRSDVVDLLRRPKELFRLFLTPITPFNLSFCFIYFCKKIDNHQFQSK